MSMLLNPYRFAVSGGGGFSPTDLTGLWLWLDSSVAGSFTYHSGSIISQWADQSGVGNHVSNATSANSPFLDTVGGDSMVRFEQFPNNTWLHRTSANMQGGTAMTVFTVGRQETGSSGRYVGLRTSGGQDWSGSGGGALGSEGGFFPSGYRGGSIAGSSSFPNVLDFYGWRFDGTNSHAYYASNVYGPTANSGTFDVDEIRLAGAPQGGDYSYCWIAELIICSASITGTDFSDCQTYLETKWGV